jgi:hypothetical protein
LTIGGVVLLNINAVGLILPNAALPIYYNVDGSVIE